MLFGLLGICLYTLFLLIKESGHSDEPLGEENQLGDDVNIVSALHEEEELCHQELKASAPRLTIELVPSSCWFSNLRSVLKEKEWKELKQIAYKRAGRCCEVCSGKGSKWPVEAHEIWHYDDGAAIQKLAGIVALCPSCHEVKHFGFANLNGRGADALEHLMQVNSWDEDTASEYVNAQFEIWSKRSERKWFADLSALIEYGFSREQISLLESKAKPERKGAGARYRELVGDEQ